MPRKFDISRVENPEAHQLDYVWTEAGCAIVVSNFGENHNGLEADFAAEFPIGNEVLSGIRLHLEKLGDRKQLTRALLDLPLEFREWDKLVEYAFADTVKVHKQIQEQQAKAVPEVLTADDILAMELPPTPWIVKDFLIAGGITILASLPKVGKSVMTMNMVRASVTGELFFHRQVPKVPFLYLALEDTKQRLQFRLKTLGISGPQNSFILQCNLKDSFDPLHNLIDAKLPRGVIVDTLQAGLQIKEENAPEMGIAVQALHDIARDHDIGILILHHHGKTKRDDPVLDLRGHTSLSAAVDIIIGLYPQETPGQFKLKSASRDGEPLDLDLAYDREKLKWKIDDTYNQAQSDENEVEMIQLLGDLGKVDIKAICEGNGKSRQMNDKVLKRLLDKGAVHRTASKVGYQTVYVYELGG